MKHTDWIKTGFARIIVAIMDNPDTDKTNLSRLADELRESGVFGGKEGPSSSSINSQLNDYKKDPEAYKSRIARGEIGEGGGKIRLTKKSPL